MRVLDNINMSDMLNLVEMQYFLYYYERVSIFYSFLIKLIRLALFVVNHEGRGEERKGQEREEKRRSDAPGCHVMQPLLRHNVVISPW